MVKHLKENEFDSEVIKADGVSIVDFWVWSLQDDRTYL